MKASTKSKGFTLIELLIVLALLGGLVAAVWDSVAGSEDKGNLTALNQQFTQWRAAADMYYSMNNMSFAGMDNQTLIEDLGLADEDDVTNYAGGANTIAGSAGNIKQYTFTAADLDEATGNQAVFSWNNQSNLSATYSGGDLVVTVSK